MHVHTQCGFLPSTWLGLPPYSTILTRLLTGGFMTVEHLHAQLVALCEVQEVSVPQLPLEPVSQ